MAQGISVYSAGGLIYHTVHERNGEYLEREYEKEIFSMLRDVDDCDPSSFGEPETLNPLIDDLDIVIREAEEKKDIEMANHLKEILVLCRLCLWNLGKFTLVISPFEYVPKEKYPSGIPKRYLKNIANAGILNSIKT